MSKRRSKRPAPGYAWIRTLGIAETPGLNGHFAPHFWESLAEFRASLLPSQRAVYERYAAGLGVAVIASELGWRKASVYRRLSELDRAFRSHNASSI